MVCFDSITFNKSGRTSQPLTVYLLVQSEIGKKRNTVKTLFENPQWRTRCPQEMEQKRSTREQGSPLLECYWSVNGVLCKAVYDVATHNRMAADETLQSPGQQVIVTILCWCQCQPYVLYQTRVYNMASQPPSMQGYSLLSLFDMCLLLLPLEDSLSCTILISTQQHIQQQQKQPG